MKNRIVSIIIIVVFIFTMLPFNVFAEESDIMSSIVSQIEEQTGNDITVEIKKDDKQEPEVSEEVSEISKMSDNQEVSTIQQEKENVLLEEDNIQNNELLSSELAGKQEDYSKEPDEWSNIVQSNQEIVETNVDNKNELNLRGTIVDTNIQWDIEMGVLTVSGEGVIPDYSSSADTPWYADRLDVTKIIISAGITGIGSRAFGNFSNVNEVDLGNDVEFIGESAFSGCFRLYFISMSDSITNIGNCAFSGCTALWGVFIPSSIITIKASSSELSPFYGCNTNLVIYCENNTKPTGWESYWNYCSNTPTVNTYYGIDRDCAEYFILLDRNQDTINISEEMSYIPGGAFYCISQLSSVIIPDSIISIGNNAFYGCTGLSGIQLPLSLNSIGENAFYGCSGFSSIEIHNRVEHIGDNAFYGCTALTQISLPNSISALGDGVFYNCTNLSSITLPDSLITIGNSVFYGCTGLTYVDIPDSVTAIGTESFRGCINIVSVKLSNSLTVIKNSLFRECVKLNSVSIPNSVTTIEDRAFCGCTSLRACFIPASVVSIKAYSGENGPFMDCSESFVLCCEIESKPSGWSSYWNRNHGNTIPTYFGVSLEEGEYWGNLDLTQEFITLPDYITFIPEKAFINSIVLKGISIPNSVTTIGARAFSGCTSLLSVDLPNMISTIEEGLFEGCVSLNSIDIPNGVTFISIAAFSRCSGLQTVNLPDTLTKIEREAFLGCAGLKGIFIPASVVTIISSRSGYAGNFYTFADCSEDFIIYCEVESKPSGWQDGFNTLSWYNSNKYATYYGVCREEAEFWISLDKSQETILIPEYVSFIPARAFKNTFITNIIISENVTTISDDAFNGCTGLTNIEIPDSVTTIGSYAFSGCTGLTHILIPDSVTTIGASAFSGCTSLSSVSLSNRLSIIEQGLFEGCVSLGSIDIPNGVTSISIRAFYRCSGLQFVNLPDTLTKIEREAFIGCTGLKGIFIPSSVVTIISSNPDIIGNFYTFSDCSLDLVIYCEAETKPSGWQNSWNTTNYGNNSGKYTTYFGVCREEAEYWIYLDKDQESVIISDDISFIPKLAFSDCTDLKAVYIPEGITMISGSSSSESPFYGCSSNLIIYCEATSKPSGWGNYWNRYNSSASLKTYYGVTQQEAEFWLYLDSSLESIIIPEYVTFIPSYAFYNNIDLKSISIPLGVESIGDDAFYGCSALEYVSIPYKFTEYVLNDDIKNTLRTLVLLSDDTEEKEIRIDEFKDYLYLESITLPVGVTRINESAFNNCSSLTEINETESITYIGKLAFAGTKIAHFDFGENVFFISGTAFADNDEFDRQYPSYLYRNKDIDGDNVLDYRYFRSVTLEQHEISINKGTSLKLVVTSVPVTEDGDGLIWESSDETIATVDEKGNVTGIKNGTVTITVTTVDGGFSDECIVTVYVFVDSISLNEENIQLPIGTGMSLSYVISPETANNKNVIWSSSDESIVIVDQNGRITGIKKGTAVITVTTEDWGYTDTCEVEVVVLAESISLNKDKITIIENEEYQLIPTILPDDTSNKKVIWTTSNRYVATVDENGLVKGKDLGTAVITATTEDGGFTATCLVIVDIPLETVELTKSEITLVKGTEETLIVTVTPEDLLNPDVIWSSSDESIVTVDATGKVSAVGAGDAVITVTTENGGKTAQCQVSVIVYAESVELNKTSLTLEKGTEETLIATVLPFDTTNKRVSWSSSDENVAIVDSFGKIYALKSGATVITVTAEDGGFTAECNVTVIVSVTFVSLNKLELTLVKGDSETLIANILPEDATNKNIIWNSSDEEVATVDSTGKVTALKAGEAVITVNTEDGRFTAQCMITVIVHAESVELNKTSITLEKGSEETFIAYVLPADTTNKNVIWTSSDETVATVDSSGKVTAINTGNAVITVTTADGGFTAQCNITVIVSVTSVSLNKSEVTLLYGKSEILIASIQPEDSTNKGLVWTSSDENVATVDQTGIVTAIKPGQAVITVTTEDGGYTDQCSVKVEADFDFLVNGEKNTFVSVIDDVIGLSVVLPVFSDAESISVCIKTVPYTEYFNPDGLESSIPYNWSDATGEGRIDIGFDKETYQDLGNVGSIEITTPYTIRMYSYQQGQEDEFQAFVEAFKSGTPITVITEIKVNEGPKEYRYNTQTVTISYVDVPVEEVLLNLEDTTVVKGESFSLNATVLPNNASNKSVIWNSSNENVATVDETGNVTAVGAGETVITVTTVNGGKTAQCHVTVLVYAEGIELNKSSVILEKGTEEILLASVLPEDTTNKRVSWSSSDDTVALIDNTGRVFALKKGTAVITVTSEDGGFTAECHVTVVVSVESVSLNTTGITLIKGETDTLIPSILPEEATNKTVIWSSTNENVAIVDQTGKVTALAAGHAVIMATTEDGGFIAQCSVTVIVHAERIELNKSSVILEKGEEDMLIVSVLPEDTTNKNVSWNSSDATVAVIDNTGRITALKAGSTVITVTSEDGGYTAECNITVIVSVSSINLNKEEMTITKGDTETLLVNILPEDAVNKAVHWTSSDTTVAIVDDTGLVTALKAGSAVITVTTEDGGYTAQCTVTVIVHAENVELNKSSIVLEKGSEETLIATVLPEDTTDKDLFWTSSNESVAIVDENGKITAVGVGSAVITVTTEDGGLTAECTVSVKIAVTSVSLNKEEITLLKGTEETLIATVLPSDATNMNLSWSSSDETVVSVDDTGRLTALKTGEAIITVTSDDGGYSAQCKVTVIVHPENVKLNKSSITLEKGSEETLIATVLPEDTTNKTLIWSSSNETVVTVDDTGKITAVGVGKAEITVITEDGGFIDQCEIRVVISVRSIYLDKTELTLIVGQDEKLIVTVLPDNATNKEVVWSDCDIADIDETGRITALSPGKQTITVTTVDGGYTAQCELTVIPVSVDNIWISKQPDKVHYYDGDVLDVTGGELTVLFNNGTSQTIPITSDMVDGFDPSKLDDWQYVTIKYVFSGIEYYCSYPILIESVYVMRIEIKKLPDKTEYMFLDELDITGGVVTVYYNNGISEDVDMVNCDVDGYDKWTVGKQEIHIYYHHQWDSFDVFVKLEKPSIKELSYDSQGNMVIVDFSSSPAAPDYIVYRRINKETSWAVIPYDATGGYYIFDHVSPGNSYYYAICCADSKGNPVSDLSEVKSITINPFKDVKENAYYYNALMWAYQNNVIAGTSSDTFSPNDNCTRGQLAVMIYRMFGKPSIAGKTIPFTDVKSSDYFYKAVVWAYNEGIIAGTSSTKFSPNSSITRQDLVVMLWRMQNKPKVTASNPFTDVNEGMYSYKAIMWAYKVGVTSGTSATKFSPKDQCTRAQIAAFLYKYNKMFHVI